MIEQLTRLNDPDENVTWVYSYDHNGLRTKKTVTESGITTVTEYRLYGSPVTHLTKGTDSLHFYYDAASRSAFVDYNGTLYAYVHNLQGDITGILDSTGTMVATYSYDAWGKPVQTSGSMANTLGKINPFRYRGYVFDEENGLYYLRSRYYIPILGRFIQSDDSYLVTIDKNLEKVNLFAYCGNNPVNRTDSDGADWVTSAQVGFLISIIGLFILATISLIGPFLAGIGIATASLVAAANITVFSGLVLTSTSVLIAALNSDHIQEKGNTSQRRTKASQMQEQVKRGQAPKEVDRVDPPHRNVPGSQDHVHFQDGTAINSDGIYLS